MTRILRVHQGVEDDLFDAFSYLEANAPEQVDRLYRLFLATTTQAGLLCWLPRTIRSLAPEGRLGGIVPAHWSLIPLVIAACLRSLRARSMTFSVLHQEGSVLFRREWGLVL